MASTKYTGVSKDKSTGKYMYYFKAGVELANRIRSVDVVMIQLKRLLRHERKL